ncbi:MAG TPA: FtsQ-type POTRA domain-containing protein [Candidatus Krumholzibacteria bacterium]|nr:FtsQ-type POTRA domain-containing protein [Candidatus Krumholzibacteria bacterium]
MTKIRYVGTRDSELPGAPLARSRRTSSGVRRAKNRHARRKLFLVLSAAALGAMLTLGCFLRVQSVSVQGHLAADQEHLRTVLSECFGKRMYLLPKDELREQLLEDPWIKEVKFIPLPTGTLRVVVEEARPVFSLEEGGAVCADGRYLPPRRGIDVSGLPRLRAPRREGTTVLSKATRELVRKLCVSLNRTPWTWPSGLSSVEVGENGNVRLITGDGVEVVLGSEGWDRRLTVLTASLPMLQPGPGDRLDLRFERQVVVTNGGATRRHMGG